MIKEVKYVVFLLTIFFSIFFVIKFYLSENNIKRNNNIILQYQNELDKKFNDLPIIKNDTNNIIVYKNDLEEFQKKRKKPIKNCIIKKSNQL